MLNFKTYAIEAHSKKTKEQNCESGAGEEGTDELVNKYKKDTPMANSKTLSKNK